LRVRLQDDAGKVECFFFFFLCLCVLLCLLLFFFFVLLALFSPSCRCAPSDRVTSEREARACEVAEEAAVEEVNQGPSLLGVVSSSEEDSVAATPVLLCAAGMGKNKHEDGNGNDEE
jgi:hypothetical protein